jgi:hypothetical protein
MNNNHTLKEIDRAYVHPPYQKRLFDISPREVCREIGLNRLVALRLRDSNWLSFDPEVKPELEEPEEAELRFLGALVTCGFDETQLSIILKDLEKPYRYRIERLYCDFLTKRWRLIPDPSDIMVIEGVIDTLRKEEEVEPLQSLYDYIEQALEELGVMENENNEVES